MNEGEQTYRHCFFNNYLGRGVIKLQQIDNQRFMVSVTDELVRSCLI